MQPGDPDDDLPPLLLEICEDYFACYQRQPP
jgi:hypothetical protein